MLAWKLKWTNSGCQLDIQLTMRLSHDRFFIRAAWEAPKRARARVIVFSIVHNRAAAMLAWKLKWPLSSCRRDFQPDMRLLHARRFVCAASEAPARVHARTRARTGALPRARGRFCSVRNTTAAMLAWKPKWPLCVCRWDLKFSLRLLHARLSVWLPAKRRRARSRAVVCVVSTIGLPPFGLETQGAP